MHTPVIEIRSKIVAYRLVGTNGFEQSKKLESEI